MTKKNVKQIAKHSLAVFAFNVSTILVFNPLSFANAETMPPDDAVVRGDSPESQTGYDVFARCDRFDKGFGDSRVEATMILRNAAGQETQRQLLFQTLEKMTKLSGIKAWLFFNPLVTWRGRRYCLMQKSLIQIINGYFYPRSIA